MMTRRSFLSRLSTGVASAALAVHLELGSLAPVLFFSEPKRPWWYLIEEHIHTEGQTRLGFYTKRVYWITAEEMLQLGFKHEDFEDSDAQKRFVVAAGYRGGA